MYKKGYIFIKYKGIATVEIMGMQVWQPPPLHAMPYWQLGHA
jgi:hypothetical protein